MLHNQFVCVYQRVKDEEVDDDYLNEARENTL